MEIGKFLSKDFFFFFEILITSHGIVLVKSYVNSYAIDQYLLLMWFSTWHWCRKREGDKWEYKKGSNDLEQSHNKRYRLLVLCIIMHFDNPLRNSSFSPFTVQLYHHLLPLAHFYFIFDTIAHDWKPVTYNSHNWCHNYRLFTVITIFPYWCLFLIFLDYT